MFVLTNITIFTGPWLASVLYIVWGFSLPFKVVGIIGTILSKAVLYLVSISNKFFDIILRKMNRIEIVFIACKMQCLLNIIGILVSLFMIFAIPDIKAHTESQTNNASLTFSGLLKVNRVQILK